MHLFWENGALTVYGLVILLTIFPAIVSIILILIGYKTGSRAVWTVGMMTMSLAVVGFLFPRIVSMLDGNMHNAITASVVLAVFAIMVWLWPYLRR